MEAVLIDYMGSDTRVADAARVSFNKEVETFSDKDVKLIDYLAKHNHWTPFSHVMITMREKVPIFVARQRFKHMVGFTYNEVSRRYVDDTPEFYTPDAWRKRAENKKQGSSDEEVINIVYKNAYQIDDHTFLDEAIPIKEEYKYFIDYIEGFYKKMIENQVAPEQARMILPQSMYTEYIVTGSLAAWARAYKLRIDEHSQKEIRDLANQWGEIIGSLKDLEHSWKALTDE